MKSADDVGITFANLVLGQGFYGNVINITLGAYNWTPNMEEKTVDPDVVVVARLRMDEQCAMNLRASIDIALQSLADTRVKAQVDAHAAADAANGAERKETMN